MEESQDNLWPAAANNLLTDPVMQKNKATDLQDGGFGRVAHFTLLDYWGLCLRRKWVILITTLSFALAGAIVVFHLPNVYRTTTVILVDPRKVPDSYVLSTVTSTVSDRLATLRQQILSTSRLNQIIEEMGLYREFRSKKTPEEIVEYMRKSIEVEVVAATTGDRGLGAFSISYSGHQPVLAAQVTNRLASLFIEENVKAREEQVIGTSEFLDRELEDAKRELQEKEARIRDIKTQYASDLPESQTLHVQALSSLQLELRGEIEAANRAQQQRLYLQSLIAESTPVINLDRVGQYSPELIPLQTQLVQAQTQLDELRKRYGPEHPDVVKKGLEVADLEKRVQEIRKGEESGQRQTLATPQKQHNPVVESQIAALGDEIQKHAEREAEIRNQINFHQSKLQQIPVLEQQIASVTRDYEVSRDHYRILLDRKFSADMSSNLETRQKAERFVVLDPAQPPQSPTRPNRPLIDLLSLVVGLGLGITVAVVQEILDDTVKSHQEVTALVRMPVFGEIPFLPTPVTHRRQRQRAIFATSGSILLGTAYLILVVIGWRGLRL